MTEPTKTRRGLREFVEQWVFSVLVFGVVSATLAWPLMVLLGAVHSVLPWVMAPGYWLNTLMLFGALVFAEIVRPSGVRS